MPSNPPARPYRFSRSAFHLPEAIKDYALGCNADVGGTSTVHLDFDDNLAPYPRHKHSRHRHSGQTRRGLEVLLEEEMFYLGSCLLRSLGSITHSADVTVVQDRAATQFRPMLLGCGDPPSLIGAVSQLCYALTFDLMRPKTTPQADEPSVILCP